MNDIDLLASLLPSSLLTAVRESGRHITDIKELALDINDSVVVYWRDNQSTDFEDIQVTRKLLAGITKKLGDFGPDNRAAIDQCLHRISRITNRKGQTIGLTIRVGQELPDCSDLIEDLLIEGRSILLLGRPGTGKTSMLRSASAKLAAYAYRVIVVDTSNEIGGDGDVPHPTLGYARRMMVPFRSPQADVMIEAVENHTPDVIVVDEISSYAEAIAARTIARRGVKLIATAHGETLEDVLRNPPLTPLLGGVRSATLSDAEAAKRDTGKIIQEQESPSSFDTVVELTSFTSATVHRNIDEAVATILAGGVYLPEKRVLQDGKVVITHTKYIGSVESAKMEQDFLKG